MAAELGQGRGLTGLGIIRQPDPADDQARGDVLGCEPGGECVHRQSSVWP